MYSGYLQKRNAPISPPAMQKVFCVLWGTLLLDYDNEEESKVSMTPKLVSEVLGISQWDGEGRGNQFPNGFLLVTHTGCTYYFSAPGPKEREEWLLHVKRGLECVFANPSITPFKPSKIIQSRPNTSNEKVCAKTKNALHFSSATFCRSCGRGFSSSDYVQELSTMLQIGAEENERCCSDCKTAQACVLWLKALNYIHAMTLHELTQDVMQDPFKYKATFKLNRRQSDRLDMAAQLLEQGDISLEEFNELRGIDHRYRRELFHEEGEKLKEALDAIGDDMQIIVGMLINPSATQSGGRMSFFQVVWKLLEVGDRMPELLDFYFPQLVHAHILEADHRTAVSLVKLDLLQQALLVLAQKYPPLALKLAWLLLAAHGDYQEKKITQLQYSACICLLLQLELAVTGVISSIADVQFCKVLADSFNPSQHQSQELGYELSALFLSRRRLQELYDEEADMRRRRRLNNNNSSNIVSTGGGEFGLDLSIEAPPPSLPRLMTPPSQSDRDIFSSSHLSCLQLWHQLGVGQAGGAGKISEGDRERVGSPLNSFSKSSVSDDGNSAADPSTLPPESPPDSPVPQFSPGDRKRSSTLSKVNPSAVDFAQQLDFVARLSELVESLRFVDRPLRTQTLCRQLVKWNDATDKLGWDPTVGAGEPSYRITRILVEDCRVFRTKARAPSLIVCEVVREDFIASDFGSPVEAATSATGRMNASAIVDYASNAGATGSEESIERQRRQTEALSDLDESFGNIANGTGSHPQVYHLRVRPGPSNSGVSAAPATAGNEGGSSSVRVAGANAASGDIAAFTYDFDASSSGGTASSAQGIANMSSVPFAPDASQEIELAHTLLESSMSEAIAGIQSRSAAGPPPLQTSIAGEKGPGLGIPFIDESSETSTATGGSIDTINGGGGAASMMSCFPSLLPIPSLSPLVPAAVSPSPSPPLSSPTSFSSPTNNGETLHPRPASASPGYSSTPAPGSGHSAPSVVSGKNVPTRPHSVPLKSKPPSQSGDDFDAFAEDITHLGDIIKKTFTRVGGSSRSLDTSSSSSSSSSPAAVDSGKASSSQSHSSQSPAVHGNTPVTSSLSSLLHFASSPQLHLLGGSSHTETPSSSTAASISKKTSSDKGSSGVGRGNYSGKKGSEDVSNHDSDMRGSDRGKPGPLRQRSQQTRLLTSNRLSSNVLNMLGASMNSTSGNGSGGRIVSDRSVGASSSSRSADASLSVLRDDQAPSLNRAFDSSDSIGSLSIKKTSSKESLTGQQPRRASIANVHHSRAIFDSSVNSMSSSGSAFAIAMQAAASANEDVEERAETEELARWQKEVRASAQTLLDSGAISQKEFEVLIQSDSRYRNEAARIDDEVTLTRVEHAFGELWAAKRERVLGSRGLYHGSSSPVTMSANSVLPVIPSVESSSPSDSINRGRNKALFLNGGESSTDEGEMEYWPVWDLRCFIVKSNDDLRQEVCCIQLMQLFKEIFDEFELSDQLWLKPYRILSTGHSTGIVQVMTDTMSLDALKKTAEFSSLPTYFKTVYGSSTQRFNKAVKNFAASLAAYSLFTHLLLIKDRHNGNILIDKDGHIIHIDFGFLLSIAPGGSFSLETAPFKLTEEMVELLGGLESKGFGDFVKAFTVGFLALRANVESIVTLVQQLAVNSPFPCFHGKDLPIIIEKLRGRFRTDLSVRDAVQHCLDLIVASYAHYGTRQYDSYQYFTNGIVP